MVTAPPLRLLRRGGVPQLLCSGSAQQPAALLRARFIRRFGSCSPVDARPHSLTASTLATLNARYVS